MLTGEQTKGSIMLKAAPDAKPVENQQVALMVHESINFAIKFTFASEPLRVTVARPKPERPRQNCGIRSLPSHPSCSSPTTIAGSVGRRRRPSRGDGLAGRSNGWPRSISKCRNTVAAKSAGVTRAVFDVAAAAVGAADHLAVP